VLFRSGDYFSAIADSSIKQLEIKRVFELELERRVQRMLGTVFGHGKALALVTVDLDFDAREMTMITYDDLGVPRSTEVIEESFEGDGPLLGEVGEPNYPGYVGLYSGSGNSRYNRNEERINNEISQITERVIAAPGKVMGIYTSVVVDAGDNELTERQLERIREQVRELVSAAIGLDEQRGDQISVQSMSFDTSYADGIEAAFAKIDDERRQRESFRQAILGGLLLLLIIIFLLALRRRSVLRRTRLLVSPEGAALEDLLGMRMPQDEEGMLEDILLKETSRDLAQKFIEDNPELSLAVLRTWLTED
jgi:flagellar M-ring protein FliF